MSYWKNSEGKFHRNNGPAVIYDTGQLVWYRNGKFIKKINTEEDDVQIEYILRNFDFEKTHFVMKAINWTWGINQQLPSIEDLKATAIYLLEEVRKYRYEEEPSYVSTGGFKATACKAGFELQFILESIHTT